MAITPVRARGASKRCPPLLSVRTFAALGAVSAAIAACPIAAAASLHARSASAIKR
jgi:hypothetical protein